jgi:predicted MFS family arabinose efflux permease
MMLCLAGAMFSVFFFITLFVQDVLGFSPLRAGFAFLPVSAAIVAAAQIAARNQVRFGAKPFQVTGALLVMAGVFWLTHTSTASGYADGVLGPTLLFGFGMGSLFVPTMLTAVSGVAPHETGAATGTLNAAQQIGGSIGLSILVTVYGAASRHEAARQLVRLSDHGTAPQLARFRASGRLPAPYAQQILAHGIASAFTAGLVFAVLAALIAVFVIRRPATGA